MPRGDWRAMLSDRERLRTRSVISMLKKLDDNSGTGPDLVSAKVLKFCADALGIPVAKLLRRIIFVAEFGRIAGNCIGYSRCTNGEVRSIAIITEEFNCPRKFPRFANVYSVYFSADPVPLAVFWREPVCISAGAWCERFIIIYFDCLAAHNGKWW